MYKLLHIHSNIVFIDHSRRFISETLDNEILFIGQSGTENEAKLRSYGIRFTIAESPGESMKEIVVYANTFDAVIFHCLNHHSVEILLKLNGRTKAFLKFFGQELYMLKAQHFLSEKTWALEPKRERSLFSRVTDPLRTLKRKITILLDREYVLRADNQEKIFRRFDAILMISKEEYNDLKELFYLPKLIERQLVDQAQEMQHCRINPAKKQKILIGNSGHRWNNHLDVLEMIRSAGNNSDTEYDLFFSYGTESAYAQAVRAEALSIPRVNLIENFLPKEEFEKVYAEASALVINSFRQHAIGNIFAAIQNGCKVYLNARSSTYRWLKAKGFLISEVSELKDDIAGGNIRLTPEEQQTNFDRFSATINAYTVDDYLKNIISVVKDPASA